MAHSLHCISFSVNGFTKHAHCEQKWKKYSNTYCLLVLDFLNKETVSLQPNSVYARVSGRYLAAYFIVNQSKVS